MINLLKNTENTFYITVSELYPASNYRFEFHNSTTLKYTVFHLSPDITGSRADKFTLWTTGSLNLAEGFYEYKIYPSGSNNVAEYGKVFMKFTTGSVVEYQTQNQDFIAYKG